MGIDVAYENTTEIKSLVDEVSTYTNLFIIGSTGITYDQTKLDDTCQYLFDKNMSFIVYRGWTHRNSIWLTSWVESAKTRWGNNFLGFYYDDEIGGKQLDQDAMIVTNAVDGTDAANQFVNVLGGELNRFTQYYYPNSTDYPLFTSDYALYWFDYKAGYDTLFAEFGWNYSRQLNVALCRGAANVQNKDWGVMITWTYTTSPYIESGEELYKDMVFAYQNGAKYIVVFDTNEEYTKGILQGEHLQAMEQFWQYVQENPRSNNSLSDRVGFALPEDYAFGFRGPKDKIWGLWEANQFSLELSAHVNSLLEQYGTKLDIIYEDGLQEGNTYGYSEIIHWSELGMSPYPYPSLNPLPSPTPTPTPPASQTPSPSPSPTPLPTQSPSTSPSSTQQVTTSPEPEDTTRSPIDYGYLIVAGVTLGIVASALVVFRKKFNCLL